MTSPSRRSAGDLWRVIAAVGVVAIHAAGGFERGWPDGGWDGAAAAAISQGARFSVPLFMVFSGFGLAASERRRGIERFGAARLAGFWRARGLRIGLPYLLFTVAGLWWSDRLGLAALPAALLRGTGDYHLYFLSFLLQGYLLWPLLRRAGWPLIAALLALQMLFASPTHLIWPGRPHIPAWIIVHWAGYLALGARLARSEYPIGRRWPLALGAWLGALALVGLEYDFWARRLTEPGHYNHFARWVVIAYALATVWLWRSSATPIAGWLADHRERVGWLAGLTFTVYLIHPWILRALWKLPLGWGFTGLFLAAAPLAFALAAALDRFARPALLRRALGLG